MSNKVKVIIILAAPRTGSTALYQLAVKSTLFPFISNFTNYLNPYLSFFGIFLQKFFSKNFSFDSSFGKTVNFYEPSEGSKLMTFWFGGLHPSQIKSIKFISFLRKLHFILFINFTNIIYRKPLIIKNAWNCFRVKEINKVMPKAKFIWLKRNILDSALSDLNARYTTKKDINLWNSATPSNIQSLKKREPFIQVIENQHEFNKAISNSLKELGRDQWIEVSYNKLTNGDLKTIDKISDFLCIRKDNLNKYKLKTNIKSNKDLVLRKTMANYISKNFKRLSKYSLIEN